MKVCDTCRFVFVFPVSQISIEWAKEKDLRAVNVFISASCELSIIGREECGGLRFKVSISYINCDVNLIYYATISSMHVLKHGTRHISNAEKQYKNAIVKIKS